MSGSTSSCAAAGDLLTLLLDPQAWRTLAELTGQPAEPNEPVEWARRVEQTVKMSPRDAIQTLFAQRMAFVADGPLSTQEGVILCRPARSPRELVDLWKVKPLPSVGRTSIYKLPPYNVGVATHATELMFGDADSRGMFDRVLGEFQPPPQPSLAANPVFQRLLARVPPNPDGVLFMRLAPGRPVPVSSPARPAVPPGQSSGSQPAASSSAPAAQPASSSAPGNAIVPPPATTREPLDLVAPRLLSESSHLLFTLHRDKSLLHISVVGDAPGATPPPRRLAGGAGLGPAPNVRSWPQRRIWISSAWRR